MSAPQQWPGEVIHDDVNKYVHEAANDTAPAATAAPAQADQSGFPGEPVDPTAAPDANAPAQDGLPYDPLGQGDIGFASGDTMVRDTPPGNDEYTHNLTHGILSGQIKTVDQVIAMAAQYGVHPEQWDADRMLQVQNALDHVAHGAHLGTVGGLSYPEPDVKELRQKDVLSEEWDAAARGAVPFGLGDELGAAVDTVRDGGSLRENLHKNRAVRDYDEENHFWARLGGEIVGSLTLPTGVQGVAKDAAIDGFKMALREQLARGVPLLEAKVTAKEAAKVAARRAAVGRLSAEGGAYGFGYGAGSTDGNVGDRLVGGAVGAVTNAVTAAGTTAAGGKVADLISSALPKVDYRALANRLEIPRTPATAGGPIQQTLQVGMSSMGGAGSVVRAGVDKENAALGAAATRAAESLAPPSSREGAGEALAAGAEAYEKGAQKAATDLYNKRDALFGGASAPVMLSNAAQLGADIARRFPNSKAFEQLTEHPAVRKIMGGIPNSGEVTLDEATEALSHIRFVQRSLEAKAEGSGPILNRVRQLKNAIQADVYEAAREADRANRRPPGPGSALQAQKDADAFYRDYSGAMRGTLKTASASAADPIKVTPGKVFNQLASDTLRRGGNLARLRDAWFRLPDEARKTFAATHLVEMGRSKPGAQDSEGAQFSFDTFLTNFDNMDEKARKIVFGRDVDAQVQDIAQYASRLRQIGRFRNFSNTAHSLVTTGILGTVGYSLFQGDLATAAEAVGLAATGWASAHAFLATPAMRDWTSSALKVATMSNPARQKVAGQVLVRRLGRIAKSDPVIANEVFALRQHLIGAFSGSTPARLAADEAGDGTLGVPDSNSQNSQDYPGEELP